MKKEETRTPHSNGMILEVDEVPSKKSQWIVLAIQHILAMFVACITVPLLVYKGYVTSTGQNLALVMIAPTIISAGVGTIFYLIMTKMKSPVFLASSFAYIAPMSAAIGIGAEQVINEAGEVIGLMPNLWLLPIGMAMVGVIYCLVALLIKLFGTNWLNKLLPPIVVGPVIMVIGLSLATSAVSNLTGGSLGSANSTYNLLKILCGIVAMIVTALCAYYGKKTLSLIPFVIGMLSGYALAAILTGIGYYGCQNEYLTFHQ